MNHNDLMQQLKNSFEYRGCFFQRNKIENCFKKPDLISVNHDKNELDKDYLFYLYSQDDKNGLPKTWFIGQMKLKTPTQLVISANSDVYNRLGVLNTIIGDKYTCMEINTVSLMHAIHDMYQKKDLMEAKLNEIKDDLGFKNINPILVKKGHFNEEIRRSVITYQNHLHELASLDMELSRFDDFKRVHLTENDIKMYSMFNYSKYNKKCVFLMFANDVPNNINHDLFKKFLDSFFEINDNVEFVSIIAPPSIQETFRDFIKEYNTTKNEIKKD